MKKHKISAVAGVVLMVSATGVLALDRDPVNGSSPNNLGQTVSGIAQDSRMGRQDIRDQAKARMKDMREQRRQELTALREEARKIVSSMNTLTADQRVEALSRLAALNARAKVILDAAKSEADAIKAETNAALNALRAKNKTEKVGVKPMPPVQPPVQPPVTQPPVQPPVLPPVQPPVIEPPIGGGISPMPVVQPPAVLPPVNPGITTVSTSVGTVNATTSK